MSSVSPSIDDDYEYEYDDTKEKKPRKSASGRKLVRWNPDLDQLVLLTVDYVCVREGIPIPWDMVMREIAPGSTGEAIKQHIAKVRKIREDNNLVVPPKLEKTARRKVAKVGGNSGMITPPSAGRVKKVKAEQEDKEENVVTPKKGATLLFHAPEKKTKTPKKAAETPKTPGVGRGGGGRKRADSESLGAPENTIFTTPIKSTGKRGRKAKAEIKEEDDDIEEGYYSPPKKQKTGISLRPKEQVNYNEQPDEDDDVFGTKEGNGQDEPYDEEVPRSMVKQEPRSSQNNMKYELAAPTMQQGFTSPSDPALYQNFPPQDLPTYGYGNAAEAFGMEGNPFLDHGSVAGNLDFNNISGSQGPLGSNHGMHINTSVGPVLPNSFTDSPDEFDLPSGMKISSRANTYSMSMPMPMVNNEFAMHSEPLSQVPSYNSSFSSSAQGSQSDQAMQSIERAGNHHGFDGFSNGHDSKIAGTTDFDMRAYEMQMPGDEFADEAFPGMQAYGYGY
ncbi:hypothetical protein LTR37_005929 [Vermiconidia calcicola]|uniref:Uncharacterized protein n=1 Tax=Vermiconidia calcicola TaxID=1690605 RepID=A0ACC3NIT4_9PEZI|nr:hypothetical protein LTR37_005929 [Vermiconidia calcicola]